MSVHNCAQIFTDGEEFVWIMPFFSKDEVGMELRSFTRRLGIPNELHFDGADEQMGYHRNFQYAIREFRIEWRNSESCSPWQNRANNLIIIIKEEWKQRTVRRRIPKNFWSFGLAWEAEIYSHTLYKGGTTGMERITVDTIYKSEWTEFCYYELFQY